MKALCPAGTLTKYNVVQRENPWHHVSSLLREIFMVHVITYLTLIIRLFLYFSQADLLIVRCKGVCFRQIFLGYTY